MKYFQGDEKWHFYLVLFTSSNQHPWDCLQSTCFLESSLPKSHPLPFLSRFSCYLLSLSPYPQRNSYLCPLEGLISGLVTSIPTQVLQQEGTYSIPGWIEVGYFRSRRKCLSCPRSRAERRWASLGSAKLLLSHSCISQWKHLSWSDRRVCSDATA